MHDVRYDKHKFRQLLLYLAKCSADDPFFGDTKLNKQLHFCDFGAYEKLGKPLTGARYQKDRHGPTARPLMPVRREMEEEGLLRVEERRRGRNTQRVTRPLEEPDMSVFSDAERQIIDGVVEKFRRSSAARVADIAHKESAGWNLVHEHEDIPYPTALIDLEPPSRGTMTRLQKLAAERSW
jgi:hypothetical protein